MALENPAPKWHQGIWKLFFFLSFFFFVAVHGNPCNVFNHPSFDRGFRSLTLASLWCNGLARIDYETRSHWIIWLLVENPSQNMIISNTWETQRRPANLMEDNQLIISILEIVLRLMNLILIPSTQLRSMLLLHNQILTHTPSDFAYLLSGKARLPNLPTICMCFHCIAQFAGKQKNI